MKLEEVLYSKDDIDSFVGREIGFKDLLINGKLIRIPMIILTKYERVNKKISFYFDKLEGSVEFLADGKRDVQLLYCALCLAYTLIRRKNFN